MCENCGYTSGNMESVHDRIKDFKCSDCDFVTSRCDALKRHMREAHQKIKKFQCNQCDYSSSKCSDLNRHIKSKHLRTFIQLDVASMYPSISRPLLDAALEWAKNVDSIGLTKEETECVYVARESLVFMDNKPWEKKDVNFDVGMGSGDSAEITELIDLFLMYQISQVEKIVPKENLGAFRDDYLVVTGKNRRENERIKKALIKIFKRYGLDIEISLNLTKVNYLDVNLNLENGRYKPYFKTNDNLTYVCLKIMPCLHRKGAMLEGVT